MIIRKATKYDANAVYVLMKELHKVHVEGRPDCFSVEHFCVNEKSVKKQIKNKHNIFFVAEECGRIIGFCRASLSKKYYNNSEKSAFVDDLYVIPEERNKGTASALFDALKSYVTQWGAVSLDLCVWNFNFQAKAFYDKMGMKEQRIIMEMKL